MWFEAPGDDVGGVEGDAEEIGGDEAELGGAETDDADDGGVDGADDPALPEFFAEEDGAEHGEDAGQVVQADGVKQVEHSRSSRVARELRAGRGSFLAGARCSGFFVGGRESVGCEQTAPWERGASGYPIGAGRRGRCA